MRLVEIVARIVHWADRQALREFHDHRPVFRFREGPGLLLVQFIGKLSEMQWALRLSAHSCTVLERACDLTTDRFANLPRSDCGRSLKREGPDCRLYFKAALDHVENRRGSRPEFNELAEETAVAKSLQRQVVRHFGFSCLEARRSANPARTRYAWAVNGGVIYVRLPVSLAGEQRRAWLRDNVDDPDPTRANESGRVQEIVDRRLGVTTCLSLGCGADQLPDQRSSDAFLQRLLEHETGVRGLAAIVADEKARNLQQQRPKIRALGRPNLRQLILRIFDDLSQECYRDSALAEAFGLSKATFSRFAGSRWQMNPDTPIPDLWRNTAQVLALTPTFMEAAREAGVWARVQQVLQDAHQEDSR